MTMTPSEFKAAIVAQCPREMLAKELAIIADSYNKYREVDDQLNNNAVIFYMQMPGMDKPNLYFGNLAICPET